MGKVKFLSRRALQKTKPRTRRNVKHKPPKNLKKLAIAFAIVVMSVFIYVQYLAPHTLEARQRFQLESTQKQLIETSIELQKKEAQSSQEQAEKQKQLEELRKKLEETEAALQAKRSSSTAYAVAPAPQAPSGTCEQWMAQAGVPINAASRQLIINESGCRPDAVNPSSGACGIPQALPCSKMPCTLQDPVCQLRWMNAYVTERYSSWEGALGFWHCTGTCYNNYGSTYKTNTWY